MRASLWFASAVAAALVAGGCASSNSSDASGSTGAAPDSGSAADAGAGSVPDAGTASIPDGGPADAGTAPADAGTPPATDAGTPDAGTPDAGTTDAGTTDAGTPPADAGAPDAGTLDADAGTPADAGSAGGSSWNVIDFDDAISPGTIAIDLNGVGQALVLNAQGTSIYDSRSGAVTLIQGSPACLFCATSPQPMAINDRGSVLFSGSTQGPDGGRPFIQRDYQPQYLPAGSNPAALGPDDSVTGTTSDSHAFVWRPGDSSVTVLAAPAFPGASGAAGGLAIDGRGRVLGWAALSNGWDSHGVIWEGGVARDLGTLGGQADARGFASADLFFGISSPYSGNTAWHPVVWDANGIHDLPCPANHQGGMALGGSGGAIVGYCDGQYDQRAMIWRDGQAEMIWDILGRDDVKLWQALRVNSSGQLLVHGGSDAHKRHFLLTPR
jgi:hypothetical protein